MTYVKWIRIIGDAFSDENLNALEALNDDEVIVVWFKLLSMMAISVENHAYFFQKRMLYTDRLLSKAFRMDEDTVRRALAILCDRAMIEIITDSVTIPPALKDV
ncbi:MAG: hypothetical protein GXX84_15820 [Acidobacteria bacterium]|jgi:hypothetical protein|nr:hypothetical protein [Acidobacteriota bacterium]